MSTQQTGPNSHKLTMVAITVSILLAVICIGVNSYLVWYLHNIDFNADNQTPAAVSALAEDVSTMDQRVFGLEQTVDQRLVSLEQGVDMRLVSLEERVEQSLASVEQIISELRVDTKVYGEAPSSLEPILKGLEMLVAQSQDDLGARLTMVADKLTPPEPQVIERFGQSMLIVQPGDSIWSMAKRFQDPPTSTFINRIVEINNISDPKRIPIGSILIIPELTGL